MPSKQDITHFGVPRNYGYRGVRLHINVFLSRGK